MMQDSVNIEIPAQKSQAGTLQQISEATNAEFELIAVHGLAADPHWTWTQVFPKNSGGNAQNPGSKDEHLLHDILKEAFPNARILSFVDNSTHLGSQSVVKTTEEIGRSLSNEIQAKRLQPHIPLIFVGHSMGGIVIKQALCTPGSEKILEDTSGIIFLGTPHQGSSISRPGSILSFLTKPLGSDTTLVMSLTTNNPELSNLRRRFEDTLLKRHQRPRIVAFYETSPTFLGGWINAGVIVPRDSAIVHADTEYYIDTDHSGLNKCFGANAKLCKKLIDCIQDLRDPSLLQQVDKLLQTQHYSGRLDIIRLSGKPLSMKNCYINLTIVDNYSKNNSLYRKKIPRANPVSAFAPHQLDSFDVDGRIDLDRIFDQRQSLYGETIPRRILIRGRAGVGKTTLCKKMVHDFIYRDMWKSMFDRVLWIPLRNLKSRNGTGYNLKRLFYDEFLSQLWSGEKLADQLWEAVGHDPGKTLFILDGMDEVTQSLSDGGDMSTFLMTLLGQHSAIITTRPNTHLPSGVVVDLELETIGFLEQQVEAYLKADPKDIPRANEIESLLEKNSLLRSLVRIPIQLDALCFIWEETDPDNVPETMAGIYSDIAQKLWAKDVVRLGKRSQGDAPPSKSEIEIEAKNEIALLECLAFNGLCNDTIDFSQDDRDSVFNYLVRENSAFNLGSRVNDVLAGLSFMRSSGTVQLSTQQSFHFLHLTYQEYFAARWFRRHCEGKRPLSIIVPGGIESQSVDDFVRRHKYTARFSVMWRFVSGLWDLDQYKKNDIENLFDLFEKDPVDLLGGTHYRLLMHCLTEVTKSTDLRARLEARLFRWVEFECNFLNQSQILCESEFPTGVLTLIFQNASEQTKQVVLESFYGKGDTTQAAFDLFPRWLEKLVSLPQLRLSILTALESCREPLSNVVLEAVMIQMSDQNRDVSCKASMVLGNQKDLPEKIESGLSMQLESDDQTTKKLAEVALRGQSVARQSISAWVDDGVNDVRSKDIRWKAILQAVDESFPNNNFENTTKKTQILCPSRQDIPAVTELQDLMMMSGYQDPRRCLQGQAYESLEDSLNPVPVVVADTVMWLDEQNDDLSNWQLSDDWVQNVTVEARCSIIEAAIERLGHENKECQKKAVEVLKRLSPFSGKTCRAISRQLGGHRTSRPDLGFGVFFYQQDLPQEIVKILMREAERGDETVRGVVLEILWDLQPPSTERVDVIIKWLGSPDTAIRDVALRLVRSYVVDRDLVYKALGEGLEDQDPDFKITVLAKLELLTESLYSVPRYFESIVANQLADDPSIAKESLSFLKRFSATLRYLSTDAVIIVANQLDHESEEVKDMALDTLLLQRNGIPEAIIQKILLYINSTNYLNAIVLILLSSRNNMHLPQHLLLSAIDMVLSHSGTTHRVDAQALLTENELNTISNRFGCSLEDVACSALSVLRKIPVLPPHVLKAVESRLRYSDGLVKFNAARVFDSHKTSCPQTILMLAKSINDLSIGKVATEALCFQPKFDERALTVIVDIAKCDTDARFDALRILKKHLPLDHKVLGGVADLLKDNDLIVRRDAMYILAAECALPTNIISEITEMALDDTFDVSEEAIGALKHQLVLPDTILKSEKLYRLWLASSFQEEICCYIEDGITWLNKPRDLGRVRLEGNSEALKLEIRRLRNKFGFAPLD